MLTELSFKDFLSDSVTQMGVTDGLLIVILSQQNKFSEAKSGCAHQILISDAVYFVYVVRKIMLGGS